MVKSKTAKKLFYYNTKTKVGQFQCPPEIMSLVDYSPADNREDVPHENESVNSQLSDAKDSEYGNLSSPVQDTASSTELGKTTVYSSVNETPQSAEAEKHSSDDAEARIAAAAALEDEERFQRALKRSLEDADGVSANMSEDGDRDWEPQELCFSGDLQEQDAQWACGQCTYINEASSPTCDMCMAVKPRPRVRVFCYYFEDSISPHPFTNRLVITRCECELSAESAHHRISSIF